MVTVGFVTKSTLGKVCAVRLPVIGLPSEKYGSGVRWLATEEIPVIFPAISRGLIRASRLFRAAIGVVLSVGLQAKVPLGLMGAIFNGEAVELFEENEITSSMAQSGMRFLAASRWCRGIKRSLRQFKFVSTFPKSAGEVKTPFPL